MVIKKKTKTKLDKAELPNTWKMSKLLSQIYSVLSKNNCSIWWILCTPVKKKKNMLEIKSDIYSVGVYGN